MIDPEAETLITFREASARFPGTKPGTRANPCTVWRWATAGVPLPGGGRLKLESVRVGGRLFTTAEALIRFVAAQNPEAVPPRPRGKSVQGVMAELKAAGWCS